MPRSECFRGDPNSGRHAFTFKCPAEDIRCFTYHAVGIMPAGTISAQLQNRGLLGNMGQELVSGLTLSLKGIKDFGHVERGKRVFQGQDTPVQGLEEGMNMAIMQ